jgi:hypothetical protein
VIHPKTEHFIKKTSDFLKTGFSKLPIFPQNTVFSPKYGFYLKTGCFHNAEAGL